MLWRGIGAALQNEVLADRYDIWLRKHFPRPTMHSRDFLPRALRGQWHSTSPNVAFPSLVSSNFPTTHYYIV
jgi:hypothetical protein